ncbi:MAG: hypothetical protein O2828_00765 [Actinomycetota bacterium]|nr:hypothetical protein [Actinomycetota bacterium]
MESHRGLYLALRTNRLPAPLAQHKAFYPRVAITKVIAIAGTRH